MGKLKLKKSTLLTAVILNLALLISVSEANAKMYKWVDNEGNTHYTQSPPPGDIQAEVLKPPSKIDTESAQAQIEQRLKEAEKLRESRLKENEFQEIEKKNEAIREENCKRARQRLNTYSRPRGLIQQEDGSRTRVDEETRQSELVKSQSMVEEYCN